MEAAIRQDRLVTVVVPCYNGARFLEETLRSALGQTHPDLEIIVVDDGSTDCSGEIARRFPVRYIHQNNRGLSEARNTGIRESKGSYLVFLDADDRLRPEAIACGLGILEERRECAITVGDHVFISADGGHLKDSLKVATPDFHYETLLKSNFIEMISTVLFRRSVFEQVGGFNAAFRVAEDYELYLRIARVRPICCHKGVVAEYRMHTSNTSLNSELMLTTTLQVLRSQARYLGNNGERVRAYRKGLRTWRKQYGRQLAAELAARWRTLGAVRLWHKVAVLGTYYPQGFLLFILLLILPAMRERRRCSMQPVSYGGARG